MTALQMLIFATVTVGMMIQATNGRDHAQGNGSVTVRSGPLCHSSVGKQHSGYVHVGGSNRYFYVAIEADAEPSKAPTFIFIGGGLGDSSIGIAMGLNGPCHADPAGTQQLPNPYDVRTEDGRESRFYKFNPGNVEKLLNRKNVQDELGVAKSFQMQNDEVFSDFRPYAAYDTTYFVNELLDQGMKVFILNGAEDFVTNYGGTEKWVFSLNGQINYGSKLSSSLRRTLQFPRVGVFGKYYRYSFANGAHLAVINVINSGHDMILDAPEGMQQAFNSFLSGQLWQG
ncbi:hypothetical protein Pmar_PMAR022586 [Perkinsus marinus ATCC 50983]|uniref:Serine carboxypeptidase n=1 Tax=Perkinsus marinus (strain ATCC 50983 / TXsc) TaxID=423536 RepID=C5KFJ0_PERM5|nr:hypothetical protein Pmar_PMAR022586 [Perkinsus marinus ATCC 50983]EER16739.1 hypothetical protein Pmar_PMAR022586 [Perkinsus marinus ATCC 50983]|eukprot:XP_002784943.1 hypothetical protein Pmar_PMAR022586 [Perkinsus marinus ATCC 50983]